jgi:hypothetical protein
LAEDWIAIWQSEITAYLTDPETQQAWAAMMAVWAGAAQAMMRSMQPPPGFGSGFGQGFGPGFATGAGPRHAKRPKPSAAADERRTSRRPEAVQPGAIQPGAIHPGADAAPRPAPPAAAPVARDDEIRRLEQRVAELERSLAEQDRRRRDAGEHRRQRRPVRPRS